MTLPRIAAAGTGVSAAAGDHSVLLRDELIAAAARLEAAGVGSPRGDAEQLAAHVLDVSRGRLALVDRIDAAAAAELRALVERRAGRVPLQHLTGVAGFRRLDIAVGPGVFIPRPETEWVVEGALAVLRSLAVARPVCVDLCSGSGAIALALADEFPAAQVHAVEFEPSALGWLRRNVERTGLPVHVHHADVGISTDTGTGTGAGAGRPSAPPVRAVLADLAGRVDLVISNPPYLPDRDRALVEPEVGRHDPPAALWGGPDGLDGPRAVVAAAAVLLRPGGVLVMEHADEHGQAVPALLAESGLAESGPSEGGPSEHGPAASRPSGGAGSAGLWSHIVDHPDLAGRDRFVTARWNPPERGRPRGAGEDA
ncbi:release factor glutamine methyltransferase [Parafrankia irregularis]|uniref:Release factor glutamine methyltransferase n=1 Tax=Parafrankia irregularis TaxID=795642 RepID=A0A0S4QN33_9ACTN|nr:MULTISPECIES: peptide chain release factor N(5)-glutamine methyltransferase [Parafrankia]MBE3205298.1 peptide chain release factor N(5)-glutamine methyltransferase [Parafrankia sp. CH37]CUU56495.1 release factor glutamine methyltransferase [Parafrankia irregularis]